MVEMRDLSAMWLIVKTLKSVLFYFSSFSISLMVVDFLEGEKCEVYFKSNAPLYGTPSHRMCLFC